MQSVVYNKVNGEILLIKRSNVNFSLNSAKRMFPGEEVGVWNCPNKYIDIKNDMVEINSSSGALCLRGEERGYKKNINASQLIYKGVFLDHGGYANMNREILFRLNDNVDINVKAEIIPSPHQIDSSTFKKLKRASGNDVATEAVKVVGFTPMQTNSRDFNICYTMMETETLHPLFSQTLNRYYDAVITPTQWNKKIFIKGNVNKPIYVNPLGVNIDIYNEKVKKTSIVCRDVFEEKDTTIKTKFNFITLFGWSYRKGIDVLLNSYAKSFSSKDDVGLIICSRYNGGSDANSKNKVILDIKNILKGYENPPKIYYYGESTPSQEMPGVLKNGDCFLWASRGEGFGLPVCEAGALNIPVVSTYNSGMTEFLHGDNSYLLETDEYIIANKDLTCISPYYVGQTFPKLGSKSIDEYSKLLLEVYNNYDCSLKKSKVFMEEIQNKYTWDICASNLVKILKEIKEGK